MLSCSVLIVCFGSSCMFYDKNDDDDDDDDDDDYDDHLVRLD